MCLCVSLFLTTIGTIDHIRKKTKKLCVLCVYVFLFFLTTIGTIDHIRKKTKNLCVLCVYVFLFFSPHLALFFQPFIEPLEIDTLPKNPILCF